MLGRAVPDGGVERLGLARGHGRRWLDGEWLAALRGFELDDARLLARHGLNLPLLVEFGFDDAYALMVDALPMRIEGRRWEPDPTGRRGFVTPVRTRGNACDLLADDISS
jgi:hypothetical protein